MRYCKLKGCQTKHAAKGFCSVHYKRYRWYSKKGFDDKTCISLSKEMGRGKRKAIKCGSHYLLPVRNNMKNIFAKISERDKDTQNYYWSLTKHGYPMSFIDGEYITLHRYIMGKTERKIVVDHINRDKLDNRRENLRFATHSINAHNGSNRINNTSGIKGVVRFKNRWIAQIKVDYHAITLGSDSDKDNAHMLRLSAEQQLINGSLE